MTEAGASASVTVAAAGVTLPQQLQSDAVYMAALMLAGRWYYRTDAPLGIAGGELGGLYVARRDPDIAAMMRGKRTNTPASVDQTWPSVEDIRERYRISSSMADERIEDVRLAAIETIKGLMASSFGIA